MDEYRRMFALNEGDLGRAILDCGGGPSSFNMEMRAAGHRVVSCDPIYRFSPAQIADRIGETTPRIVALTRGNMDGYCWDDMESPEKLCRVRLDAMRAFLDDYGSGRSAGRYVLAGLPSLPFGERMFDIALCSHLLFTYSGVLDAAFHIRAIAELARVAWEVRVFPLVNLDGKPSPHLAGAVESLGRSGLGVEVRAVDYCFQRGTGAMLRVTSTRQE